MIQLEKTLTIEHLLPKEWEKHWLLPENASTPDEIKEASKFRNEMLHKVGNLSLVTKRLNPALSNGPWLKKRDKILEHSALNMNRVFQNVAEWNETLIHKRSLELFKHALKIWCRPKT